MDKYKAIKILDLEKSNTFITVDNLKKVYREKAKKLHPDKGGTAERFKELGVAYQFLLKEYPNGLDLKEYTYTIVDILNVLKVGEG